MCRSLRTDAKTDTLMVIFDIVMCIVAMAAVISGWRRGFIVQAFGLAAVIAGIAVAARTGAEAGMRLGIDPRYSALAGFFIVFVCAALVALLIGHIIRKIFRSAGFGILDILLGIFLSFVKVAIVAGIGCAVFDRINNVTEFVPRSTLDRSITYRPLCRLAENLGLLSLEALDGAAQAVDKGLDHI